MLVKKLNTSGKGEFPFKLLGFQTERRHGSTRLPGHAFLAWWGCVHLLYNTSWKFHQHAAGQLLLRQPVYGPSITYKIPPAVSLFLQPARRGPPCWASPLTVGLIVSKHPLTHQSHSRPRGWAVSLLPPPRLPVPAVPHLWQKGNNKLV